MQQELRLLKEWLDAGNKPIKAANDLGYSTPTTILNWFDRENIPDHKIFELRFFLKKEQKNGSFVPSNDGEN